MKNIFIAGLSMEIGGAERALLGLLYHIDTTKYTVDLFLNRHEGEFMSQIPKGINLLPQNRYYASLAVPLIEVLRNRSVGALFGRTYAKMKAKQYRKKCYSSKPDAVELEYSHKYTVPFMPYMSEKKYDVAISFCAPHYFVSRKVSARKKIAWIHTDYTKISIDVASELEMWNQYDHIVSISDAVTESFLQVFPSLEHKVVLVENILPEKLIREQAKGPCPDLIRMRDEKIILSVGRFSYAKNFDHVPWICKRILELGVDVTWYLIGYGGDEQLIREQIAEAGMEQHVKILGKRENPYPYINACDLYVQPSRYEGKAVTVREAQMLGKPVVITRYATSASQLEEDVDGVIVPLDNEGCAQGIAAFLRDPEKMEAVASACKARDYSNAEEVGKLDGLMEE